MLIRTRVVVAKTSPLIKDPLLSRPGCRIQIKPLILLVLFRRSDQVLICSDRILNQFFKITLVNYAWNINFPRTFAIVGQHAHNTARQYICSSHRFGDQVETGFGDVTATNQFSCASILCKGAVTSASARKILCKRVFCSDSRRFVDSFRCQGKNAVFERLWVQFIGRFVARNAVQFQYSWFSVFDSFWFNDAPRWRVNKNLF